MRLSPATVRAAFRAHHDVYARERGWTVDYHVDCWTKAQRAFDAGTSSEFDWLYHELKRRWQALRGPRPSDWTADETFDRMGRLDSRFRSLRLREFNDADLDGCWCILQAMSGIKPTRAPSVVAISKFLHFWNPGLFVIVDDAVMWQRVFSRSWLKRQIDCERDRIESLLTNARCVSAGLSCDLLSYLAVLAWASRFVRAHPGLMPCFDEYVRTHVPDVPTDLPLAQYDAGAVEWVLLGLAELPPAGVELLNA